MSDVDQEKGSFEERKENVHVNVNLVNNVSAR